MLRVLLLTVLIPLRKSATLLLLTISLHVVVKVLVVVRVVHLGWTISIVEGTVGLAVGHL